MIENHPYQETADAIAQFSVATALDRDMVATMTATNAKLTLQLEKFQAYVKNLKEDLVQLKLKIKLLDKVNDHPRRRTTASIVGPMCIKCTTIPQAQVARISRKDTKKATKSNPMGGVKWGKYLCGGAAKVIDRKLDQFHHCLDRPYHRHPPVPVIICCCVTFISCRFMFGGYYCKCCLKILFIQRRQLSSDIFFTCGVLIFRWRVATLWTFIKHVHTLLALGGSITCSKYPCCMNFESVETIGHITSDTFPVTNARILATQHNTTVLTTNKCITEISILANVCITCEAELTDTAQPYHSSSSDM
jgi:hypothetical protein